MKCPSCNSDMKKGWIPLARGLTWKELGEGSKVSSLKGNIQGIEVGLRVKKLFAYRCDECKIISFYFGEKAEK